MPGDRQHLAGGLHRDCAPFDKMLPLLSMCEMIPVGQVGRTSVSTPAQ